MHRLAPRFNGLLTRGRGTAAQPPPPRSDTAANLAVTAEASEQPGSYASPRVSARPSEGASARPSEGASPRISSRLGSHSTPGRPGSPGSPGRPGSPGSPGSPGRSSRSRRSQASTARSARHPTRVHIVRKLQEPASAVSWGRSLAARLQGKPARDQVDALDDLDVGDEDEDERRDVVDELALTVEPVVEELGDEAILAKKRAGTLDVEDEETLAIFRKHKAVQGKALFEAENANNVGVEHFGYGDVVRARAYFDKALELTSQFRKPAAKELADFREFVSSQFNNDRQAFYTALSSGEWRLALSRRRFVLAMKKINYPGDPERLFSMMDFSGKSDGKITPAEMDQVFRTRPLQLNQMDRDLVQKGVILSNLAACDMQQGNPSNAVQKLREAAKIVHRWSENESKDARVQRVMSNIATAYIHLGDHDSALNYLNEVLTNREAALGPHDADVLSTLFHIGYCFLAKASRFDVVHDRKRMDGRQQEKPVEVNGCLALCAFKELLQRQEAALAAGGDEQLRLEAARSHEIIAEVHDRRGELDRAMLHLRSAVGLREEMLAESDPELLSAWNVLAAACVRAGQLGEALVTLEKATVATIALFGEQSLAVATELYFAAIVHLRVGARQAGTDREEAAESFRQALDRLQRSHAVRAELLGEESTEVAACFHLTGSVLLALGERADARRNFQKALLLRMKLLGRAHTAVASTAHALGCLYARTPRRQQEAVLLLRRAVRIRERRLSAESSHLAASLHELGAALLRRRSAGDAEAALPLLSRAAQIREQCSGKQSLAYAASMQQVGQAHAQLGLASEARLYLQAALALRERLAGRKTAQTAASRFALGVALYHLGDYSLAMKQLKLSYALREELFGAEHPLSADSLHQIGMVYIKKGDLTAALPFLLRALDTRIKLNEADCKAREEDSDEDPRDLVRCESARERRIQKRREKQRKLSARKSRISSRISERVSGRMSGRVSGRVSSRSSGRRSGRSQTSMGLQATESEASSLPSPAGEGRGGGGQGMRTSLLARVSRGFGRFGRSSGGSSQQGAAEAAGEAEDSARSRSARESVAGGGREDGEVDFGPRASSEVDAGSELGLDEVGVDVKGWLAGGIGNSMHLISIVYMDLEDFVQSKYYLDRALCLREEVFGAQSPEYGESMHLLGTFYTRRGEHLSAFKYYKKALHVRERAYGHAHESTAATCGALGTTLAELGQAQEASLYLFRAIGIREHLFGPDDEVLISLREKWNKLAAEGMHYDPVAKGEALPHFAQRTGESHLHGFAPPEQP